MALQNPSINIGVTSVAPTGGTSTAFALTGSPTDGNVVVVDTTAANLSLAKRIAAWFTPSKNNKSSLHGRTQVTKRIKYTVPKTIVQDNVGNPIEITQTTLEITLRHDERLPVTDVVAVKLDGSQLLSDSDFDNFWKYGSTV